MISTGEGYVWRHRSGRYFVSHWHHPTIGNSACHDPSKEAEISYSLEADIFRATLLYSSDWWATRWLELRPEWRAVADQFEILPGPGCQCCGERPDHLGNARLGQFRCAKHLERNPCAIEGCRRTRKAEGQLRDDQWLCSEHWRAFVPPRSRRRKIYHAYFRKAKRYGWNAKLRKSFWRYWDRLVADARKRSQEDDLDINEINRIMGWENAA